MPITELETVAGVDWAVGQVRFRVEDKREKALLAEFRMHKWRGNTVYAHMLDHSVQALIAVGYGKRKPVLNIYTLFTALAYRGQSYMTVLLDHVEAEARRRGLDSLKSKASSMAAVWLYHRRGYTLLGATAAGEILVEAPLRVPDRVPGLEPAQISQAADGKLYVNDQLAMF